MEIDKRQLVDALELIVSGRLDAYWSDHLGAAIEESLRAGGHRLRVDMRGVVYMSSAGIRVLLRFRKQVHNLGGSFVVVNASDAVRNVLQMVGLEALFADAPAASVTASMASRQLTYGDVAFDVVGTSAARTTTCRIVGDPTALALAGSVKLLPLQLEPSLVAIGVGLLGDAGDGGGARVGELLSVAGAATYLPADGTGAADYVVAAGTLLPQAQVLYAAVCDMAGAPLLRFESASAEEPLGLNALIEGCLEFSGATAAAVVMVAEAAGLMGAALRRSPVSDPAGAGFSFGFPQVREWLSFAPERVYPRSVALVTGIVGRRADKELEPILRPLASSGDLVGHFHAAAFAYRPVRKGNIELASTVRALFDDGAPLGILHLLNDDRAIVGSGESLFVRGACWVAPIAGVEKARA